jgi:hypothetical protein
MEFDLRDIQSASLNKKSVQDVLKELAEVAAVAADARDMELVHDPELRKALNVVEDFLRESHRICYGGMAINAHLPKDQKFYDFNKTLPDYDFFTPDPERDIAALLKKFKSAGFTDVSARVGMHEGTTKIFVNYTGVADITEIPYWMYNILLKRSIKDDDIQFADADFLRMNMYLELSRPRGEVERWDKVYKRLILLNKAKVPSLENCGKKKTGLTRIGKEVHNKLINYIAEKELTFAGAELQRIYRTPTHKSAGFILKSQSPIVAFAENPGYHIPVLRQILHTMNGGAKIEVVRWSSRGDFLPELYGIKRDGELVILLVTQNACNAYNTVNLPGGKKFRIAALDTAITLYYTLTFVRGMDGIVPKSVHCFAESLVDISVRTRDRGDSGIFPLFVESCEGHQPSKASLIKAKVERMRAIKTRRRSSGKRSTAKKRRN